MINAVELFSLFYQLFDMHKHLADDLHLFGLCKHRVTLKVIESIRQTLSNLVLVLSKPRDLIVLELDELVRTENLKHPTYKEEG